MTLTAGRTQLPGRMYETYSLVRPLGAGYWRKGTCEEAGCLHRRNGWVTRVPFHSPQAAYIRAGAGGRAFTETTQINATEHEFLFPPGQDCFGTQHRVPLEREPLYVVRGGRSATGAVVRRHTRGEDWRDDMGERLDKLKEQHERERG